MEIQDQLQYRQIYHEWGNGEIQHTEATILTGEMDAPITKYLNSQNVGDVKYSYPARHIGQSEIIKGIETLAIRKFVGVVVLLL